MSLGARTVLGSAVSGLAVSLFPPRCAACDELGREPFCPLCSDALLPAAPFSVEGIERSEACLAYGGPAAVAVHRLKYEGRQDLGRSLGQLLSARAPRLAPFDVVVPMPLSPGRLRKRGYNQARELARSIAGRLFDGLERVGAEAPQVGASRRSRLGNVQGAFIGDIRLRGRRVLLVDDVATTGATARAAGDALREVGAASVCLLVLLRSELT